MAKEINGADVFQKIVDYTMINVIASFCDNPDDSKMIRKMFDVFMENGVSPDKAIKIMIKLKDALGE